MQQSGFLKSVLIGFLAGLPNGLLGVGGGTILVPAMVCFLGYEQHEAHATALAVVFPTALVSSLVYAGNRELDLALSIKVTLGSVIGGYLGARLLSHLSVPTLRKVFAVFLIAAAVRMVF